MPHVSSAPARPHRRPLRWRRVVVATTAAVVIASAASTARAGWIDPPVQVGNVEGAPSRSEVEVVLLDNGRAVAAWMLNGESGGSLQASFRDPGQAWSTPVDLGPASTLYQFTLATNGAEAVIAAGFGTTFSNVNVSLTAFELAEGSDVWSAGTVIQNLVTVGASSIPPIHVTVGDDGIVTVASGTDPAGSGPRGALVIQRIDGEWGAATPVVSPTTAFGLHLPDNDGIALGMSHVDGVSRVTVAAATIDRGADESLNSPDDEYELVAMTAEGDGGWSAPVVVHSTTGALTEFGDIYRNIAVGASDGDAVVVWTDSDMTEEGSIPGLSARVRLANGSLSAEQTLTNAIQTSNDVFAAGVSTESANDVGVLWSGLFDNTVRLRVWNAADDTWGTESIVNPADSEIGEGFAVPTDLVPGPTGEMVVVIRTSSGHFTRDRSAGGQLAASIVPLVNAADNPGMNSGNPDVAIGGADGTERIAVVGTAFGEASGMFVIETDSVAPVITSASVSVVSGGTVAATATATDNLGIRSIGFDWGDASADTVGTATSAQHTYTASGTYTVTISVTDTASNVTTTTRSVTVTVIVAPSAPRSLRATPRNSAVALAWTAPASTGGATVTDYVVQFRRAGASTWSTFNDGVRTTRSATVTRLKNGTRYEFRVSAKNSAGQSSPSTAASATPRTVPTAPRDLSVGTARGAVALTWKTPSSNGGAAITDYVVQYRKAGSKKWKTFSDGAGTAMSARVTGLASGVQFQFRVRAVNAAGTGAWSAVAKGTAP